MKKRGPAMAASYVRTAQRLLRKLGRDISAGGVSWHTHNRAHYAGEFDLKAEIALEDSGLFERANFVNGNKFGISLWRERKVSDV